MLQSNTAGATGTDPQTTTISSQVANFSSIQSSPTSQPDLSTSQKLQVQPGCSNNCVAAVSTTQKQSSVPSIDLLGGGLLLASVIVVAIFAKKVLTS